MKLFLVTYIAGGTAGLLPDAHLHVAPVLANNPQEAIETLIKYMGKDYTHKHTVEEIDLNKEKSVRVLS